MAESRVHQKRKTTTTMMTAKKSKKVPLSTSHAKGNTILYFVFKPSDNFIILTLT